MKRKVIMTAAVVMGLCLMAGCSEADQFKSDPDKELTNLEDGVVAELEAAAEQASSATQEQSTKDSSFAAGSWYTDDYDPDNNWAMSYVITLSSDGRAECAGWRNKDAGTYEVTGDNKVLITFDKCETDEAGEGFKAVDNFKYTIEMTVSGDDADIKIDAPEVISNLENGKVHRKTVTSATNASEEGDEGEGTDIADGTYFTDMTYKGDISADGATISIETALNHEDENYNLVMDYEKRVYVFSTSKDCKCVVFTEDREEAPIAERVEFINEFLRGNSGLPISLTIKNNELTEIGFSS